MKPINVGLLGIGTVGGGTFTVLSRNAEEIARRAGRPIQITVVADKNLELAKTVTKGACRLTDDAFSVVNDPEIDIVVELIGGCGVAKELVLKAIHNGKHVVTANKALLANHGNEIFVEAQTQGVIVAFEAAVAGGIPIIKAVREGLTANRIEWNQNAGIEIRAQGFNAHARGPRLQLFGAVILLQADQANAR